MIHMHILNYNYFIEILDVKLGLREPRAKKGWKPMAYTLSAMPPTPAQTCRRNVEISIRERKGYRKE